MARAMAAMAAAASMFAARGRSSAVTTVLSRSRQQPFKQMPTLVTFPRDFSIATAQSQRSRTYSRIVASDETSPLSAENSKEFSNVCPKGEVENGNWKNASSEELKLNCAVAMLPHPEKAAKGGEDAYFVEGSWMGVADGVGGWASEGVDAGAYSRELMGHCKALVASGGLSPKEVLVNAAHKTKARGSATALVAVLEDNVLQVANLGDSGFVVIRDWKVVYESQPMQHDFNFPFQIGTMGDNPEVAKELSVQIHKGDIVILGTDGLFDNLFKKNIEQIIKDTLGNGSTVQEAAARLALKAQIAGNSPDPSPFSEAAQATRLMWFKGGKLDDVTAVVALVTS